MFDQVRIGLRNLRRSHARTAFSLLATGFGVASLVLAGGFIEWTYWAMREAAIQTGLGHIQVTRPGYRALGTADPYRYLLPDRAEDLRNVAAIEGVRTIAPRLELSGLVSRGETTIAFLGHGVDPEREAQLSTALRITAGQPLSSSDQRGVVVGKRLAGSLGAEPGDRIVLLAKAANGSLNAVEVTVRGITSTGLREQDETEIRLPISTARALTRVEGSHVWVIALQRTEQTAQILPKLRRQVPRDDMELTPWYELADFYRKAVVLFSRQMLMMKVLVVSILVLTVANAMVMHVLERTGEIGTIMAIGATRRSVLQLFLTEGLVLGAIGGGSGILAALILGRLVSQIGIPMPPPPGRVEGYTAEIMITPELLATGFLIALVSACVASLYPAWKASRMNIVDALRHNR